MKKITIVLSVAALAMILVTAIMVFNGRLAHDSFIICTNVATIVWFATSPFWLAPKKKNV
jgi:hypothetical protein